MSEVKLRVTVKAVVTRADGSIEDLGVISEQEELVTTAELGTLDIDSKPSEA